MSKMRHSAAISNLKLFCEADTDNKDMLVERTASDLHQQAESSPECVSVCVNDLPLSERLLIVHYDPVRFCRRSNNALESAIHSLWRRQRRDNPRLFNGSKFRVAGVGLCSQPSPETQKPNNVAANGLNVGSASVEVRLGVTCYRDHLATNCNSSSGHLLQRAGMAVNGDPQAFLADCLGVGALVLTADNRLVLIRRARWTSEYPDRLDRPGGHAEPHHLLERLQRSGVLPKRPISADAKAVAAAEVQLSGSTHSAQNSEREQWTDGGWRAEDWLQRLSDLPSEEVRAEVFDSVRREVHDELGVSLLHLSQPLLMGLVRDTNKAGRPTLEFLIRCALPSSDVLRVYSDGRHAEADESTEVVFIHQDEITGHLSDEASSFLTRIPIVKVGEEVPHTDLLLDPSVNLSNGHVPDNGEESGSLAAPGEQVNRETADVPDQQSQDIGETSNVPESLHAMLEETFKTLTMDLGEHEHADNANIAINGCDAILAQENGSVTTPCTAGLTDGKIPDVADGGSHDSGCGDISHGEISTKQSPAVGTLSLLSAEDRIRPDHVRSGCCAGLWDEVRRADSSWSTASKIEITAEITNRDNAAQSPVSAAEAARHQVRQLWPQMTPACHASMALLRSLNLKLINFTF